MAAQIRSPPIARPDRVHYAFRKGRITAAERQRIINLYRRNGTELAIRRLQVEVTKTVWLCGRAILVPCERTEGTIDGTGQLYIRGIGCRLRVLPDHFKLV